MKQTDVLLLVSDAEVTAKVIVKHLCRPDFVHLAIRAEEGEKVGEG
jgi:hypothetical protein